MDYGNMRSKLEGIASRAVAAHSPSKADKAAPEAPPEDDLMAMLVEALKEAGGDEENEAVKDILARMEEKGMDPEESLSRARAQEEDESPPEAKNEEMGENEPPMM